MRGLYTNQKRQIEHFGPMLCSRFFSYSVSRYSYSYSQRSSIAIRPIGPQVAANRLDQRSESLQLEQPSSTSTVSLSTVRRGGLSTSTTKSDARHERKDHPGPRSARPTGGLGSRANRIRSQQAENRPLVGMPQAPGWLAQPEAKVRDLNGICFPFRARGQGS